MTHCSRCDASVSKPGLCERCRGMEDLIERLSGATGPAFVLDQEIARTIGAHQWHTPLAYTASLDAAMTLVPEGHDFWDVGYIRDEGYTADVAMPAIIENRQGVKNQHSKGATPAIALCIASLKARSLKGNNNG